MANIGSARMGIWAVLVCAALAGCSSDDHEEQSTVVTTAPSPAVLRGHSVLGRELRAEVVGDGPENVLVIGVIHGSEPVGAGLVERLVAAARASPSLVAGRRLIAVADLNPDGHALDRRENAHGVDLNRNFPAGNFTASRRRGGDPLSEPESRFLHDLIVAYPPARVVSIHQPLACVNFDGPAEDLARRMAATNGFRIAADIGYDTPGSLGSWLGKDRGVPVITLEHTRSRDVDAAWKAHGAALLLALSG